MTGLNTLRGAGLAGALVIAGALTLHGSVDAQSQAQPRPGSISSFDAVFPRVKIIDLEGTVARLDTTTGQVHTFNGDLSRSNVRGVWRLFIPAVAERTSGFLEIQSARGNTFLVDALNGKTWILRHRGTRALWELMDVFNG